MLIYRFRITSDDHEGFLREIEIQPNQTFLDFHFSLMETVDLRNCDKASFFKADRNYRKLEEITLKTEKREVRRFDDDLGEVVTELVTLRQMKNVKVKILIDDPHQKLLYIFLAKDKYVVTLQIELFKILQSDGLRSLPACVRQTGEIVRPTVAVPDNPPPAGEEKTQPPAIRKPAVPKLIIPPAEELVKLDNLVEDEKELAEIESNLNEILKESAPEVYDTVHQVTEPDESFTIGEDDPVQNIDDFENIDQMDTRYQYGSDSEQDDY